MVEEAEAYTVRNVGRTVGQLDREQTPRVLELRKDRSLVGY